MTPCRVIVDPPLDGAWNMAVDEALLDDAVMSGSASLRFYQWREPTLSLGYFQSYRQWQWRPASPHIPVVRRLTGGGALVHDRELTYSLCLPASHRLARESTSLYRAVHHALIETFGAWGVSAALYGDYAAAGEHAGGSGEPFLCFARRTEFDVVLGTPTTGGALAKILGSAQRRRRGAVLQHGGVLLGTSSLAPELPGLAERLGVALRADELLERWSKTLAAALELDLQPQALGAQLAETAQRLQREKYGARFWTERR